MPSRGSGFEVAAANTTFSPKRTTAARPAWLASFPVSKERDFPLAISTETFVASGFIDHPFVGSRAEGVRGVRSPLGRAYARGCGWQRTSLRLSNSGTGSTRNRSRAYLRMPSLEITVLYRSESYFFR